MADELTIYAQELLIEASRDNGGLMIRGYESEPPDPGSSFSAMSAADSFRQNVPQTSDSLRRTGSAISDDSGRLGFHTNGRFIPLLEDGWNSGFVQLLVGDFIEPRGATRFTVSPKGRQMAKQLVPPAPL